jgi:hypothetical protein
MQRLLIAVAFLLGTIISARADFVPYHFILTVTGVGSFFGGAPSPCHPVNAIIGRFICSPDEAQPFYVGTFRVDDSLLLLEGNNLQGIITDFYLQIGTVIWDQNHPFSSFSDPLRSHFSSFEGPIPGICPLGCISAASPGFNVHGGLITGLQGGVRGPGDMPFVDFSNTTFSAVDTIGNHLTGQLTLSPIPEPETWLFLAIGFVVLVAARVIKSRWPLR